MKLITNYHFKKLLIVFWTIWWLLAFWTDLTGGLQNLKIIHAHWIYANNFPALVQALKMYAAPLWLAIILFVLIVCWSFLSTILFIYASLSLAKSEKVWLNRAKRAFIVSLSFWLALFIADQIVMKFVLEQNHMVQGGFELLSFLTLYLLPNETSVE